MVGIFFKTLQKIGSILKVFLAMVPPPQKFPFRKLSSYIMVTAKKITTRYCNDIELGLELCYTLCTYAPLACT